MSDFSIIDDSLYDPSRNGSNENNASSQAVNLFATAQTVSQNLYIPGNDSGKNFIIQGNEINVNVSPSSEHTASASNKVKTTSIVNYDWESKYYYGNLVAAHRHGIFLAYVLNKSNSDGIVRIINRHTTDRFLLKDFKGHVIDLAFEFADEVVLAVIDKFGNTYIYWIETSLSQLNVQLMITIKSVDEVASSDYNRVIWCPYIPEENEADDERDSLSRVIFIVREAKAEIWYLHEYFITNCYPIEISTETVTDGFLSISNNSEPITDAAFAPDLSAVAIASSSGYVKFFQALVSIQTEPRCLHEWTPHGGRPISSLFFLDDHSLPPQKCLHFWKYCVTGSEGNTEICIWTCKTWTCLQTIRFTPSLDSLMKASMDPSAKYLILSDITRKVLYVLHIEQDTVSSRFASISDFRLTQPCLSFVISDAHPKILKHSLNDAHLEGITTGELDNGDGDLDKTDVTQSCASGVEIKLFSIHPKMLQEMQILYEPLESVDRPPEETGLSGESATVPDQRSDLSTESTTDYEIVNNTHVDQTQLLTPEAFSANILRDLQQGDRLQQQSFSSSSSFTHVTPMDDLLSPNSLVNQPSSASPAAPATRTLHDLMMFDAPLQSVPMSDSEFDTPKSMTPIPALTEASPRYNPPLPFNQPTRSAILNDLVSSSNTSDFTGHQDLSPFTPAIDSVSFASNFEDPDVEVAKTLGHNNICDMTAKEVSHVPWPSVPLEVPLTDQILTTEASQLPWPSVPLEAPLTDQKDLNISIAADRLTDIHIDNASQLSAYSGVNNEKQSAPKVYDSREDLTVLSQLKDSQTEILTFIKEQQKEIEAIKKLIQENISPPKVAQPEENVTVYTDILKHYLAKVEESLSSRVCKNISESSPLNQIKNEVEKLLSASVSQLLTKNDQFLNKVTYELKKKVPHIMEQVFKQEMQASLISSVNRQMEPFKEQIQSEIVKKLTVTDSVVKENISKLFKSKQTIDSIGQAAGVAITPPIQLAYQEAFTNLVVPKFQAATGELFHQLNATFTTGITEYVQSLDKNVEKMTKTLKDSREPLVHQLSSLIDTLKLSNSCKPVEGIIQESVTASIETAVNRVEGVLAQNVESHMKSALNPLFQIFEENFTTNVRNVVREEVSVLLRQQSTEFNDTVTNAIRSRAATPVPQSPSGTTTPVNVMVTIRNLLQQKNYSAAIDAALSVRDLKILLKVCKLVKPSDIFSSSHSPPPQQILLSLIQQLTAEFDEEVELRYSYLNEAIVSLDTSHSVTKTNLPVVLKPAAENLRKFIRSNPEHSIIRSLRLLLMAIESLSPPNKEDPPMF